MHRAAAPPAPDLFGSEGQERREQPQQSIKGGGQGCQHGRLLGLACGTVGPVLDEFNVVVRELPEEALADLQGTGVVVVPKGLGGLCHDVRELRQHGAVQRVREHRQVGGDHRVFRCTEVQDELRGVEELDGEAAADLHLGDLVGGVRPELGRGRPVAYGVRSVLVQDVGRDDHVALGLGHLLAVRVEDPARDGGVLPRCGVLQGIGAHGSGEQPRPDDVVGLRAHVKRVHLGEEVLIRAPAAYDLRRQRGRGPGVEDVGVAGEAAGLIALGFFVPGSGVSGRVDRELFVGRQDRGVIVGVSVGVERVPDRHGHAKEALAGHEPVAVQSGDPVLVA
ncbi:hypothetical protein D9M72_421560 [compost metagenome]